KALGTTPHAYLVMVRVSLAQTLLAAGATPAEAAAGAGFSDQAHLGVWFPRMLGVTPAAYRRQVRGAISLQTAPTPALRGGGRCPPAAAPIPSGAPPFASRPPAKPSPAISIARPALTARPPRSPCAARSRA